MTESIVIHQKVDVRILIVPKAFDHNANTITNIICVRVDTLNRFAHTVVKK